MTSSPIRPIGLLASFFLAGLALAMPSVAAGSTIDGRPKVLLHVRPITAKNPCATGFESDPSGGYSCGWHLWH